MDALSDVLRVTQLTGGVFLHAEFSAPWCMGGRMRAEVCAPLLGPVAHVIPYHYVVSGDVRIRVEGSQAEIVLRPSDLVLFPRNDTHVMGSDLGFPPVRGDEIIRPPEDGGLFTIRYGGGGKVSRIVCGYLGSDSAALNPLIAALPAVIRLNIQDSPGADWIRSTFQFAADEVAKGGPGSETVLAKLSELLFVETIRRYVESLPEDETGWLAGLRDPYVGRTLALFHRDARQAWTHDELSREVGLSRSALADRFTRLIGAAPMQYLANWRMQIAAQKLRNSTLSLAQIAGEIGYESEAAFSRAFKKAFGIAPGTWRRTRNGSRSC